LNVDWQQLAQEVLGRLGFDVLEASLRSAGRSRVLLVRIERRDEVPVSVADLERASHVLGDELDRRDLIEGAYRLEVESPGPERPLFTARHFERFVGLKVRVRSEQGNFTARIQGVRQGQVDFKLESGESKSLELGSFKANLAEWPDTPR
jgi:ribosome maturation factor RimP